MSGCLKTETGNTHVGRKDLLAGNMNDHMTAKLLRFCRIQNHEVCVFELDIQTIMNTSLHIEVKFLKHSTTSRAGLKALSYSRSNYGRQHVGFPAPRKSEFVSVVPIILSYRVEHSFLGSVPLVMSFGPRTTLVLFNRSFFSTASLLR